MRILKRDLLCGMTRFETNMYYTFDEKSKEKQFELPEWLKKECPTDLSFITNPEKSLLIKVLNKRMLKFKY